MAEKTREEVNEYHRNYYQKNRVKLLKYLKERHGKLLEKSEKVKCGCGKSILPHNLKNHEKSRFHRLYDLETV